MRPVFEWNLGARSLLLGKRTTIMGVLNVTPDSFSDGGIHFHRNDAVEFALQMIQEGADIIDVGGESTRPGAPTNVKARPEQSHAEEFHTLERKPVSEAEELERVVPVIRALKQRAPECFVSIDTYRASVAQAAFEAGAEIVNDVSGFRWDPQMKKKIAALKCGSIMMHMRGRPEEWRTLPPVTDTFMLVKRELREWADAATVAGIKRERMVLDPGFGFGKNFEQNYPLLQRFQELHELRYPLLAGVSRKSFLGRALARDGKDAPVNGRLVGTLAAETALVLKGAQIIRTHEVRACRDATRIADIAMM
jgi:dihydropteroate synthase